MMPYDANIILTTLFKVVKAILEPRNAKQHRKMKNLFNQSKGRFSPQKPNLALSKYNLKRGWCEGFLDSSLIHLIKQDWKLSWMMIHYFCYCTSNELWLRRHSSWNVYPLYNSRIKSCKNIVHSLIPIFFQGRSMRTQYFQETNLIPKCLHHRNHKLSTALFTCSAFFT